MRWILRPWIQKCRKKMCNDHISYVSKQYFWTTYKRKPSIFKIIPIWPNLIHCLKYQRSTISGDNYLGNRIRRIRNLICRTRRRICRIKHSICRIRNRMCRLKDIIRQVRNLIFRIRNRINNDVIFVILLLSRDINKSVSLFSRVFFIFSSENCWRGARIGFFDIWKGTRTFLNYRYSSFVKSVFVIFVGSA